VRTVVPAPSPAPDSSFLVRTAPAPAPVTRRLRIDAILFRLSPPSPSLTRHSFIRVSSVQTILQYVHKFNHASSRTRMCGG
jgi:hypothetical protein